MMCFDRIAFGAVGRTRFNHVRIDGSLHQEGRVAKLARLGFKDADESFADCAALGFGFDDSLEAVVPP